MQYVKGPVSCPIVVTRGSIAVLLDADDINELQRLCTVILETKNEKALEKLIKQVRTLTGFYSLNPKMKIIGGKVVWQ